MRTRTWLVFGAIAIVGIHLRRTRDVVASVPLPVREPEPEPEPVPVRAAFVPSPVRPALAIVPVVDDAPTVPALANAIVGEVRDPTTGDPLFGTTVIATDRDGRSTVAISEDNDDRSSYTLAGLSPGLYHVTFYFASRTDSRDVLVTSTSATTLDEDLEEPPRIDPGSTVQGITIDEDYIVDLPVPSRTFESVLGAAADSQGDTYGVSFTGTTSLENTYVVVED